MRSGSIRFSANLGLLWTDRPLPAAVAAAARAGFAAVEAHWPWSTPPATLRAACARSGLPLVAVNTDRGGRAGDFGLAALPGRAAEARAATAAAMTYAAAAGAGAVHVMAGRAEGAAAAAAFRTALDHACDLAAAAGLTVLIEPINRQDVPGYFLDDPDRALDLVAAMGRAELKVMIDLYHLGRMGRAAAPVLAAAAPVLGHVQIAGLPDRGPPGRAAADIPGWRAALAAIGWQGLVGAEYRPPGATDDSLDWRADWA